MLNKIIGYLFLVIGFIGIIFFRKYNGSVIPYSLLWYVLCFAISIGGLYLINLTTSSQLSKQEKYNLERLNQLKQSGEKIILTVDNCEIKENNYCQEVMDERGTNTQAIDALIDPYKSHETEEYIEQAAVIYYYKIDDQQLRMTSQSFSFNAILFAFGTAGNILFAMRGYNILQDYRKKIGRAGA